MNTERFLAKRLLGKGSAYRVAKPIIKIAVASTAISVAVMLLSVFVVKGFQKEIRQKIVGFGGHIQITAANQINNGASTRVTISDSLLNTLAEVTNVKSIAPFAHQPGILETAEGLHGVMLKGVSENYHWQFISNNLIEGTILKHKNDIVLSKGIANLLNLHIGDKLTTYVITNNQNLKPRKLKVVGIFATGLEDIDKNLVYVNLSLIQNINKWGLKTTLAYDSVKNTLTVKAFGGESPYQYKWSNVAYTGLEKQPLPNTNISVYTIDNRLTISDTAYYKASTKQVIQGRGTDSCYVGGYEVLLNNYNTLTEAEENLYRLAPYNTKTNSIISSYPEIFNWLNMLDANVALIITIMIIVAVINLSSTLLILILEKTAFIGLLKAMGAYGASIRKIFLYQAQNILLKGLVYGNIIAFSLAAIQYYFSPLKLNPESYFIENVPIEFNLVGIATINLGTFVLCLLVMILPAHLIGRITPVKAIKFD